MSMRLVVTGASGFLGGHICARLDNESETMALYHRNPQQKFGLNWRQCDLTNRRDLGQVRRFRPDVIIHTAAMSNLDQCEKFPKLAWDVNVTATKNLAFLASDLDCRLIFTSTDMVFDGAGQFYREHDPINPISLYGQTKVTAEECIQTSCCNYVIARVALIYGRPQLGGASFLQWLEQRLGDRQTVELYKDQFRTPIWADNLVECLLELAKNDFVGTLHLGGANRIDRYQFGLQFCEIAGYDKSLLRSISMKVHQMEAPRPADLSLSIEKAKSLIGIPLCTTQEGLSRMCNQQK